MPKFKVEGRAVYDVRDQINKSKGNRGENVGYASLLRFDVPSGFNVYNIVPVEGDIAGRVGRYGNEDTSVMFFQAKADRIRDGLALERDKKAPVFDHSQDPSRSYHGGKLVFGVVKMLSYNRAGSVVRTDFYMGNDIYDLRYFTSGPEGEKDIRLVQWRDMVVVARRPQKGIYGKGRMLYQTVPNIYQLPILLQSVSGKEILTPELDAHYRAGGWAGANQLISLNNGIGILFHTGIEGENGKVYEAFTLELDLESGKASGMKKIAGAEDFPEWKAPFNPDLDRVVFPGRLVRRQDGTAELYAGIRDSYAAMRIIADPFLATAQG